MTLDFLCWEILIMRAPRRILRPYALVLGPALVVAAVLIASPRALYAQTACPMGVSPGDPRCGPTPEYANPRSTRQYAPQRRWETRWGAIAMDARGSALGASNHLSSRRKAEREAVAECQGLSGASCEVLAVYSNSCIAVVVGDSRTYWNSGEGRTVAVQGAFDACSKKASDCSVLLSECSPPTLK